MVSPYFLVETYKPRSRKFGFAIPERARKLLTRTAARGGGSFAPMTVPLTSLSPFGGV
jgi:hypothetical protein